MWQFLSGFIFIAQYECRVCVWILLLPCSSGRVLCAVFLMIMCSFSSKCIFCCLLELRSIHRLHEMWPMHKEEQGFDYLNCMEKYAPCQNKEGLGLYSHLHSYKSGVTALKLEDWYHCKPNLNIGKIWSTNSIYKNTVVLLWKLFTLIYLLSIK